MKNYFVTGTDTGCGKTVVSSPSNLIVSRERNFRHILQWNDNSYNEDGFSIQRKESKDIKWKPYQ